MTAPTPEHGYLLIKRGLYYRPNAAGYTGVRDRAGRYSLAEAEAHQDSASGVTITHESIAPEFSQSCYEDVKVEHLRQQRDSQAAELTRLRAENARLRELAAVIVGPWKAGEGTKINQAYADLRAVIKERAEG